MKTKICLLVGFFVISIIVSGSKPFHSSKKENILPVDKKVKIGLDKNRKFLGSGGFQGKKGIKEKEELTYIIFQLPQCGHKSPRCI